MGDFIRILVKVLIIILFLILIKYYGLLMASTIFISIGILGIIILGIIILIDR